MTIGVIRPGRFNEAGGGAGLWPRLPRRRECFQATPDGANFIKADKVAD
jgi:hypothetical protein